MKRIAVSPTVAGIRPYLGQKMGKGEWSAIISETDYRPLVPGLTHPPRKTTPDGATKHLFVNIAVCGARIPIEEADAVRRRAHRASNEWLATFDNEPAPAVISVVMGPDAVARWAAIEANLQPGVDRDQVAVEPPAQSGAARLRHTTG